MYLKSIKLYGFKSFANKMIFEFDKGITAIVGPNGSGKSNIADAVRWVLGEQSAKQLRSSRMQDVIFAGTEARKPLGYSQVDLTIDNQNKKIPIDYLEVTVSRRVYRSGEGEYFINGAACRMRDIQELFMDTGVGQDGYSIIGQGQIDKILSNKPEERRALFDEAVGIVKFKKRKKNAEKQLEIEKQNLYRISDIITELEGQKTVLIDQAEKAKSYLELKEVLKVHEVTLFITEVKEIDEKLTILREKEKISQEQIESIRKVYEGNKLKHAEFNKIIETLEFEIEDIIGKSSGLSLEKEKKESDINLAKEQIHHINENNQRLDKDNSAITINSNKLQIELDTYQNDIASLLEESKKSEELLLSKEGELTNLQDTIEKEDISIGSIQSNMIEKLNGISTIKSRIQHFSTMVENTYLRTESIKSRKIVLEASLEDVRIRLREAESTKKNLVKESSDLEDSKNKIKSTQFEEQVHMSSTLKEQKEKSSILQTLTSKYKALEDIAEHYEGYNYSIKKVMALKDTNLYNGKILGVIADILKVSKDYERAIEIALGGTYQNIVVEDTEIAKSLIKYLKENKYGRATFLPITSIHSNNKRRIFSEEEIGVFGYADELITVEAKYKEIVRFLLGRTVVVKNIDTAIKLAKKYNNTLRIVTLAGDLINPGGSLTGGAYKNNKTQFLARKRDLEMLKVLINESRKESDIINKRYQKLLSVNEKQSEKMGNLREEIQKKLMKINEQNILVHQLKSEILKGKEELETVSLEEGQLVSQDIDFASELVKLNNSLEEVEIDKEQAEITVKELMSKILELKEEKEKLVESITKLRVSSATVIEQKNHAINQVNRMKSELLYMQKQLEEYKKEINLNKERKIGKEEEIKDYISNIKEYNTLVEEIDNKRNLLSTKRHSVTKEQEVLYKEQEASSERINILEKELIRLENQLTKVEEKKESYILYMWEEYEITLNKGREYFRDDLGRISAVKEEIKELKDKIRSLGDVNVNAIEEYKHVLERYEFLSTQKNDLVEAEEKLRDMIKDLERHMQEKFIEQFSAINLKFQQVFKELFGGGKAFLELENNEDILSAGIHISAQPPGKKLQNMSLLSGGERAFTAIALLFAIQSLKPSPFCVLDEIEAALDDANVERFAKYLQKLSINTQFIIITHRRGTMEVSDALYGITMEEKGISAQVSVKLVEDLI